MCVWDLLILFQIYILACEAHKIEQLCGEYGKKAAQVFSTGVPIVMRKQQWLVARYNFELTLISVILADVVVLDCCLQWT